MNRNYVFIIISLLSALSLVLVGCGSDSDSVFIGGATPGTFVISGAGGNSTYADGGTGGYVEIESDRDIIATTAGSVDASFTVPAGPTYMDCSAIAESPTAGDMGEEFSPTEDTIVNAVLDDGAVNLATAGEYYLLFDQGTPRLYVDSDLNRIVNATDADVDCIDIPGGVTVTLKLNNDYDNDGDASGADQALFYLSGDLRVAGTLRTALMNTATGNDCGTVCEDRGDLDINAHQVYVTATGVIDTSGDDARWQDQDGGKGGEIDLYSGRNNGGYIEILGTLDSSGGDDLIVTNEDENNDGGNASEIDLRSSGSIYVAGTIIAEGGDGENDAGGAEVAIIVDIDADSTAYFTGTISTVGGDSLYNGSGGDGGDVDIYSDDASVFMAGTITTDGGDSGDNASGLITSGFNGGNAGDIEVDTDDIGTVVISTVMSAVGGDSRLNGHGGDGGDFESDNDTGDFLFAGSFDGSGGNGDKTDWPDGTSNEARGGDAGDFDVYVDYSSDEGYGEDTDPGDIMFGGKVTMAGGFSAGGNGGDGGQLYLGNDTFSDHISPPGGSITLVGIKSFDVSGGNSVTDDGGDGGDNDYGIDVETGAAGTLNDATYVTGAIYWGVPVDMSGGNGAMNGGYDGGDGGDIWVETNGSNGDEDSYNRGTMDTVVILTSALDASGGNGDNAGDGGEADIYGYNMVNISAPIDVSGGKGAYEGGDSSSDGEDVEIYATEYINVSAKLDVSGGDATKYGGDSDDIYIQSGIKTTVTGGIDASGGNAVDEGGDSGWIDILSQIETSTVTLGNININRGTGGVSSGQIGYLLIDWMDFSPTTDELGNNGPE